MHVHLDLMCKIISRLWDEFDTTFRQNFEWHQNRSEQNWYQFPFHSWSFARGAHHTWLPYVSGHWVSVLKALQINLIDQILLLFNNCLLQIANIQGLRVCPFVANILASKFKKKWIKLKRQARGWNIYTNYFFFQLVL